MGSGSTADSAAEAVDSPGARRRGRSRHLRLEASQAIALIAPKRERGTHLDKPHRCRSRADALALALAVAVEPPLSLPTYSSCACQKPAGRAHAAKTYSSPNLTLRVK